MAQELSTLHAGVIQSLPTTPTASDFQALSLTFGGKAVLEALDLIDHGDVSKISTPNGRFLYTVTGSTGTYTVYPNVLNEGYCPCPAFSQAVIHSGSSIICKHLLAVLIAEQLDAFTEKSQGLSYLAGLATNFASTTSAA